LLGHDVVELAAFGSAAKLRQEACSLFGKARCADLSAAEGSVSPLALQPLGEQRLVVSVNQLGDHRGASMFVVPVSISESSSGPFRAFGPFRATPRRAGG
jgi:hypothetical protein